MLRNSAAAAPSAEAGLRRTELGCSVLSHGGGLGECKFRSVTLGAHHKQNLLIVGLNGRLRGACAQDS